MYHNMCYATTSIENVNFPSNRSRVILRNNTYTRAAEGARGGQLAADVDRIRPHKRRHNNVTPDNTVNIIVYFDNVTAVNERRNTGEEKIQKPYERGLLFPKTRALFA